MKIVENLAFKGGGVLGAAYAGALTALEEYRLVGHSGGPEQARRRHLGRIDLRRAGGAWAQRGRNQAAHGQHKAHGVRRSDR